MDDDLLAAQSFNGGIIFVSYVIATVGAQTALELLGRRTHINGIRNWLFLIAAALAMGGVGIWSMHFIGNNSLTLMYHDNVYHLSYSAGYTFASLVVAIACMFVAFAFVGVTEEAQVMRIIPSGIIAGIGIACMHYIGQFAIDFFHLTYKVGYVAGAVVIACAAVVTALYIFFKLREHWSNRWYKRLGSSMLMGLAVCGMHYTAMAGTEYRVPSEDGSVPEPALSQAALIGIIAAIVVLACGLLLFIAIRAGVSHLPAIVQSGKSERLMLGAVFFDRSGKILVNVDGLVPTKEVLADIDFEADTTKKHLGGFNTSHPLFLRFFEATHRWAKRIPNQHLQPHASSSYDRGSEQSSTRTRDPYDAAEMLFFDAARELVSQLRLSSLADLGILFDNVVSTNTIATKLPSHHQFLSSALRSPMDHWFGAGGGKNSKRNSTCTTADMARASYCPPSSNRNSMHDITANHQLTTKASMDTFNSATMLEQGVHHYASDIGHATQQQQYNEAVSNARENKQRPVSGSTLRSAAESTESVVEDRHLFMVRRVSKKEQARLMALGYRFADPVFISKTMGAHLHIPSDHMNTHFEDMRLLAHAVPTLLQMQLPASIPLSTAAAALGTPNSSSGTGGSGVDISTAALSSPSNGSIHSTEHETIPEGATRGSVYVGLSVMVQEDKQNDPMNVHILVDKARRYTFPMVRFQYADGEIPTQLSREERNCVLSLHGQTLQNIGSGNSIVLPRASTTTNNSTLFDATRSAASGGSNSDWAGRSGDSTTMVGSRSPDKAGTTSPIAMAAATSPVSPIDNPGYGITALARFTQALEDAGRRLMGCSMYGKPLSSVAKLQGEVIDIPPFALTLGPCQMILFRAWVTSPGTISAINQTSSETIKCLPIPLYRSLAYYITDQAAYTYRSLALRNVPESAYVAQQRVYQSTASYSQQYLPSTQSQPTWPPASTMPSSTPTASSSTPVPSSPRHSNSHHHHHHQAQQQQQQPSSSFLSSTTTTPTASTSTPAAVVSSHHDENKDEDKSMAQFVSLPPPPRARKPKVQSPHGGGLSLASLQDVASSDTNKKRPFGNSLSLTIELPTILSILPTLDRFWWLNNVIEETMHGD